MNVKKYTGTCTVQVLILFSLNLVKSNLSVYSFCITKQNSFLFLSAEGTVQYATQYGGVFSTCVRQPPLSKLKAEVIIILILINNLKQVKL